MRAYQDGHQKLKILNICHDLIQMSLLKLQLGVAL